MSTPISTLSLGDRIRQISSLKEQALEEAEEIICDSLDDINDSAIMNGLMAETNTYGPWEIVDHEVKDLFIEDGKTKVALTFTSKGESDLEGDRPFSGDTIFGTAIATVSETGEVSYEVTQAEHEDVRDPEDR